MYFARDQTDDNGGQKSDQHADDEAAVVGIGEHPQRNVPQFGKVDHDDRQNRAELNQDDEAVPESSLAETEEFLGEQHMTGRGHRQEFGDALDNAEDHCPQSI